MELLPMFVALTLIYNAGLILAIVLNFFGEEIPKISRL